MFEIIKQFFLFYKSNIIIIKNCYLLGAKYDVLLKRMDVFNFIIVMKLSLFIN